MCAEQRKTQASNGAVWLPGYRLQAHHTHANMDSTQISCAGLFTL